MSKLEKHGFRFDSFLLNGFTSLKVRNNLHILELQWFIFSAIGFKLQFLGFVSDQYMICLLKNKNKTLQIQKKMFLEFPNKQVTI